MTNRNRRRPIRTLKRRPRRRLKKKFKVIFLLGGILIFFLVGMKYNKKAQVVNSDIKDNVEDNIEDITEDNNLNQQKEEEKELPWNLVLANKWNKLPNDFSVKTVTLSNGHSIDERAYNDLQDMMDSARSEGLSPVICSSYRSMEYQIDLYDNQIKDYINKGYSESEAKEETEKWIAIPGTSEHQTGLALDIVSLDYQNLDEKQEDTPEQKWLLENSYKYGFILRYPKDKTDITGISYEPWHYRYVGKEAAKEIFDKKISLEEYLENLNKK